MSIKLTLLAGLGGFCVMAAPMAGASDGYAGLPAMQDWSTLSAAAPMSGETQPAGVAGPRGEGFTEAGPAATAYMTQQASLGTELSAIEDPADPFNIRIGY